MSENRGRETLQFAYSYSQHRATVLAYCVRRTAGFHDAEDATEEVFEIAWIAGGEKSYSIAWLIAVARNVLRNQGRRLVRDRNLIQQLGVTPRHEKVPDESLTEALETLLPLDRRIILLTYWCGLTASEIAQVTGSTTAAIWTRLTRIRGVLRVALIAE